MVDGPVWTPQHMWVIAAVVALVIGIGLGLKAHNDAVHRPNPECVGLSHVNVDDPQSVQEGLCADALNQRESEGTADAVPYIVGGIVVGAACYWQARAASDIRTGSNA